MAESHGWINSETVKTRFGDFEFRGGYPTQAATDALYDQLKFNRAIEVYLTQIPAVAVMETRRGFERFGVKGSDQTIVWETLMDAKTLLLTANTETVYCLGFLNLHDGPMVFEAPPSMLGNAMDAVQRFLVDFGPLGPDKGEGGKYLFLPPGDTTEDRPGYFTVRSPTFSVIYGLRGFKVDNKTDQAVALMKRLRIYPLVQADNPPELAFFNGSGQPIDTIHSDTITFFEALDQIVQEEPAEIFTPLERFHMQSIGIEKGKPFAPDRALLAEAAHAAAAFARSNCFASHDLTTFYYPGGQWQQLPAGVPYTFLKDGVLQVDSRAFCYYMGLGNDPAMMDKHVGQGSQYLWAYRDADGDFLDGAKNYRLRVPADVPIANFWSVLVYDSLSRSQLQTSQAFPSISKYSAPQVNDNGTIDVWFGPRCPEGQERNWIETLPDRGWFPIFRFYSPLEPFFDKTWKLPDVMKA
ncbi:DUF1254 domain-containing protein (plasmid) [Novosphingobium sp. BL-8A]|uniref:DUF1254 domain-containing protein n=1 Tax=Novosphingobium sp. BL-8A TaxID=3127639 RepID=UPI0037566417